MKCSSFITSKYHYLSRYYPSSSIYLSHILTSLKNSASVQIYPLQFANLHELSFTLSQFSMISYRPCFDPANKSRFVISRSLKFGFSTRAIFGSFPDIWDRPKVTSCTDVLSVHHIRLHGAVS
jgi:hypothetical protein